MLEIDDLTVKIHRLPILRGISLKVGEGEIVGLVGRNGAGKTTTLRSVMGLIKVEGGSLRLDGTELLHVRPHQRARLGLGYMPEDRRLIPTLTVEQNVLLPTWTNDSEDTAARLRGIYDLIPEVEEFASRSATQLSGGQQKLVALARALMVGRRLLLLDEPFEGVAPALAQRMGEAIKAMSQDGGLAVLLAESEHRHVRRLAAGVYTIERGEVLTSPDAPGASRTPVGDAPAAQ